MLGHELTGQVTAPDGAARRRAGGGARWGWQVSGIGLTLPGDHKPKYSQNAVMVILANLP